MFLCLLRIEVRYVKLNLAILLFHHISSACNSASVKI